MKLFQSIPIALLISATSFVTFAKSSHDNWQLIDQKPLTSKPETDTVEPNGLLKNRQFSKIKIKIKCTQAR
jgi:hypothetical protein